MQGWFFEDISINDNEKIIKMIRREIRSQGQELKSQFLKKCTLEKLVM